MKVIPFFSFPVTARSAWIMQCWSHVRHGPVHSDQAVLWHGQHNQMTTSAQTQGEQGIHPLPAAPRFEGKIGYALSQRVVECLLVHLGDCGVEDSRGVSTSKSLVPSSRVSSAQGHGVNDHLR
jgi:hypothetical protein